MPCLLLERLMAVVRRIHLFAVQSERLQYRPIGKGKERCSLSIRGIDMLMASPRWHSKNIPLFPRVTFAIDDAPSLPLNHQVDTAARLAMRLRMHARTEELC